MHPERWVVLQAMKEIGHSGRLHNVGETRAVQFVGACPPGRCRTRPARTKVHATLAITLRGYPEAASLRKIYRTMNRAMLLLQPALRSSADELTEAMVRMYESNAEKFAAAAAASHVYSPRGSLVAACDVKLRSSGVADLSSLVRLWLPRHCHCYDRLVTSSEREWCENEADAIARSPPRTFRRR